MDQKPPSGAGLSVGDSWSNWDPDPERAFREHDPALEPFASMSRHEILDRMRNAKGGRQWEFLREYLLDRCTAEELRPETFLAMLEAALGLGFEEFCLLADVAGPPTRLIMDSGVRDPMRKGPSNRP